MPLMEQELLTLPKHLCSPPVYGGVRVALWFYVWIVVCPFVPFRLAIVLFVLLRYVDSDYHFGIFKLFLAVPDPLGWHMIYYLDMFPSIHQIHHYNQPHSYNENYRLCNKNCVLHKLHILVYTVSHLCTSTNHLDIHILQLDRRLNKAKNKRYHTIDSVPKFNTKIVERGKIDTHVTHTYMTDHFPDLVQALQ